MGTIIEAPMDTTQRNIIAIYRTLNHKLAIKIGRCSAIRASTIYFILFDESNKRRSSIKTNTLELREELS